MAQKEPLLLANILQNVYDAKICDYSPTAEIRLPRCIGRGASEAQSFT